MAKEKIKIKTCPLCGCWPTVIGIPDSDYGPIVGYQCACYNQRCLLNYPSGPVYDNELGAQKHWNYIVTEWEKYLAGSPHVSKEEIDIYLAKRRYYEYEDNKK